jgi:hypothetical protein
MIGNPRRASVGEARAVRAQGPLVEVVWRLEGGADAEWAVCFVPDGPRHGSHPYVSGRPPSLRSNGSLDGLLEVWWVVPEGDIEDAQRYVRDAVEAANRRYEDLAGESNQRQGDQGVVAQDVERLASITGRLNSEPTGARRR